MPFTTYPSFSSYTVGYLIERAWALRARCSTCPHVKLWYAADLAELPSGASISDLLPKLTCSECGSADGIVDVLNDKAAALQRTMAIYEAKNRK